MSTEEDARVWLIMDVRARPGGNVVFWREGGSGYTEELAEAGVFTEREARISQGNRHTDVPVRLDDALRASVRTVPKGVLR